MQTPYMLTVEDHRLGRRSFVPTPVNTIRDVYELLCRIRDEDPELAADQPGLAEDIRAYEAVLFSADAETRAHQYFTLKGMAVREGVLDMRPRHVARELGWIQ